MESRTKSTRKVDDTQRKADLDRRQELWTKWAGQPRACLPDDPSLPTEATETDVLNSNNIEGVPPDAATSSCDDNDLSPSSDLFSENFSDDDEAGFSDGSGEFTADNGNTFSESSDEDEDDALSEDHHTNVDDQNEDRMLLLCQACSDVDPPPSCPLDLKGIVVCLVCLQVVPKAVLPFHIMKFHAMAPYLNDEVNAHFTDFLPGHGLDDDGDEIEEEEDEEEGSEVGSSDAGDSDAGDNPDYASWNVAQLKDELKSRKAYTATEVNRMKKLALIEALKEDDIGEASSDDDEESSDNDEGSGGGE